MKAARNIATKGFESSSVKSGKKKILEQVHLSGKRQIWDDNDSLGKK
ncbi:hypothetical protein [Pediococcus pentosaceus]|jgi:hypothetical protein|uniref:Uncharacterized protein n=1 Tax=Pediococcus pentosaceus (strain ATCC 25745 / CCUG 21536 / LMG 10740 / 183-1w) TaxID=278197 RepID=Q03HU9_PEDPA|nr:hypothetical protein [Pediococcus pentosaceus]ABJ67223.1 hypothetical protein PEPE_0116 [Pediococcus pentosaceus ATCC 25745]AHA05889.1 hypothetical protein T256_00670 [Pediococcus pentosaceus SL4]MBF7135239.1 hypothetical protein [Pediococcus pentosaceus]